MAGHELLLSLGGGVALLLWAARMIRTGIMRAYGASLRFVLGRSTRNRFAGFAMGVGAAGLLQSSTATALLAMSFAGRGLIATAPALAIMLGADLGSTLVVQVLSFDIGWLSPVFMLFGVIAFMAGPAAIWRHLGRVSIGLALMLLSLGLIVGASAPLRESPSLQAVLAPLAGDPILAVGLAALLTWVAHSSVAMVLLIMSLTATAVVTPPLGFALVLGANIGAGIIPMAIGLSEPHEARRVPLGNLLFRVLGALAVLALLPLVIPYIGLLGPEPARQIANFHTLFNLALAVVFLPFIGPMAHLTARMLPAPRTPETEGKPRHLDRDVITVPALALSCATREVLRMADIVESMLRDVIVVFETNDKRLMDEISARDDDVDALHAAIKLYLTEVSRNELKGEDSERFVELITFTTNLEHIGDIIDTNLLQIADKKIKRKLEFSVQGRKELSAIHSRVIDQMRLGINVLVSRDVAMARRLMREKESFREVERAAGDRHMDRLREGEIATIETSALHLDLLRDLKRVTSHITSIAYPMLDAEGELRKSRLKVHLEGYDGSEGEAEVEMPAPVSKKAGKKG